MIKLFFPITLTLMGCHAAEQQALVYNDFSPLGTWSSSDGFSIKIDNDMTYSVCDRGECESGEYFKESSGSLILIGFFSKNTSQRFIALTEAQRACDASDFCTDSSGKKAVNKDDLYFYDSIAPVDVSRKCGNVACVIIGNVETAAGTLHKTK